MQQNQQKPNNQPNQKQNHNQPNKQIWQQISADICEQSENTFKDNLMQMF